VTNGLADVRIIRPGADAAISFPPHAGELVFCFMLEGSARLERGGLHRLEPGDAFVVPPGEAWSISELSPDLRMLHVTTGLMAESA
jgi:mannose-6-phosphate isomerase-like protein (cupin superfamily)